MTGVWRRLGQRLRNLAYLDEEHIWYTLDLAEIEQLPLAEGYVLQPATDADLDLFSALSGTSMDDIEENRSRGAQPWLVKQDRDPAFVCWIFPKTTPVRAAAGRWLEMPSRVACLEDSFTSASHRGRGIAGAAWTKIAHGLSGDGFEVLITKVDVENVPSRKAVGKAGFREACLMRLRRRGSRETVTVEKLPAELTPTEQSVATELQQRLERP